MISKIGQTVETVGLNKVITKTFQRNLDTITSQSAYINDSLYFRRWTINGFNKKQVKFQSYHNGKVIKGSQGGLDVQA